MRSYGAMTIAMLALPALGCRGGDARPPDSGRAALPASAPAATNVPAEDGQWTIAAKDHANTRWSGLLEIDATNVSRLALAWTFSTGVLAGHEGAPLVAGSTMYVLSPFPHTLFALDLARPGAPVRWRYAPPYIPAAPGVSCCGRVNRGPAYADGVVYFATLDDQVVAVDAESGRERWRVTVGAVERGETMTMAPVVVKGKVLVGNSGGEFGVRGWLTALDAATGRIVWRAYSTGPDEDVLIGEGFTPFYEKDRGTDLGVSTWPPEMWKRGGGTAWGWISYDPELDLVYYGTGNAGVWNPDLRPGDNKWAASIFARDPDTGEARWAYQVWPHDRNDYDAVNESVLLDLPLDGATRKVLVRAERNGFMYIMDRATGEVIAADSFAYSTSTKGVDLATGRPLEDTTRWIRHGRVVREICPAVPGGKDWQPMAYSFRTGLLYVPGNNLCMDVEGVEANYIEGTPYVGAVSRFYAGPGGHRGMFFAWDPVSRRKVWSVNENFPVFSGALVTAGDVVFYGTMDRWLKALDARTGEVLWRFRTASGIVSQPITYRGPDGKQYVAVFDGVGGWPGAVVSNDLDPRDSTAADGFVGATSDLPQHSEKGGTLYVFALP